MNVAQANGLKFLHLLPAHLLTLEPELALTPILYIQHLMETGMVDASIKS